MPRYRRQNIDRKTNKPELKKQQSSRPDLILIEQNKYEEMMMLFELLGELYMILIMQ
jgi:hypothetical protein